MKQIVQPLLHWYIQNKTELPWRQNQEPYDVWISEIMLQQTRIEAVKKYYARFKQELPTIHDLAIVEEEKLLKLWEGLGYYNRAKNLKKAAQKIEAQYHGKIPNSYTELLTLPGIGEYTAGAIASICFQEKVPAVDGNVLRVISRILASYEDVLLNKTKKDITQKLQQILPNEVGNFNQALMELGEKICLPSTNPLCETCPIQQFCQANKQHLVDQIPVRNNKTKRKKEERTVFILVCQNKIAIVKRPDTGLLSGMYEFPNILQHIPEKSISAILKNWELTPKKIQTLGQYKHIFSHIEWRMIGYEIQVRSMNQQFLWVLPEELKEFYALPTAFLQFEKRIEKNSSIF